MLSGVGGDFGALTTGHDCFFNDVRQICHAAVQTDQRQIRRLDVAMLAKMHGNAVSLARQQPIDQHVFGNI